MLKRNIIATVLSGLLLVLVLVNIVLALGNQSLQAEVGERQQIIAQTIQLETLHRQVVAVLANLAIKSNDQQLKDLLASIGVDLGAKQEPPAPTK